MRHNSEGGSCSDVKNVKNKNTALTVVESHQEESGTDNVYENVTFFQGYAKFGDIRKNPCKNSAASQISKCDNFNSDIQKFISHHATR